MAENNNSLQNTIDSLMKGMDGLIASKTVVGEPIEVGRSILLPLVDVSFGMGAGSFAGEKKRNGAGGIGGKISPTAVLVIQDGYTKMVSVKNQDGISKLLDMLPDFIDNIMNKKKFKDKEEKKQYEEARAEAEEELKESLNLD